MAHHDDPTPPPSRRVRPRRRATRWLATAVATVAVVAPTSCSGDGEPDRDALITKVRHGDATLDDERAGCIVDGLTERFGAPRAGAILDGGPGGNLPPEEAEAVATVAVACSGAPDLRLPSDTGGAGTSGP